MRFYFGFSKRFSIKKIIKWIPLIATGLFAFFGIGQINAKALTDTPVPVSAKQCDYNGLFTDSNCISLPYPQNCPGYSSWFTQNSCYVPDTTNTKLEMKSVWYEYTNTIASGSPCTNLQYVTFNVDVLLDDTIAPNGSGYTSASEGPFVPTALNYNAWGTNPTTRGGLTKANNNGFMNLYWRYIGDANSKNQYGIDIRGHNSSGYYAGSCQFVSYGSIKSVKFTCRVPARGDRYYVGVKLYNNAGGLSTSSVYARPSIHISQVSDPCEYGSSGAGSEDVVDSIGDWGNNIINNNNSNTQSITGAISQQTNEILDGMGGIENSIDGLTDAVNSATSDIIDNQDETNDKLDEIDKNTTSCKDDIFGKDSDPYPNNLGYFYSNGTIISNNSGIYKYTDYISLGTKSTIEYTNYGFSVRYCAYDDSKTLIGCYTAPVNSSTPINVTGAKFIRLNYVVDGSYVVKLTRCSGMGDALGGLTGNTSINSSEVSSFLSQIEEMIDDQPIQRLLSMPITLLNSFYNNVSTTTCSSYNIRLDLPGNNNLPLEFTCPNYNELIGSTGATLLDAFMCFALCWGIAHAAIHFYEECSSAKDTFDELYKGGK